LRAGLRLNFLALTAIFVKERNNMPTKLIHNTTKCAQCLNLEKQIKRLERRIVRLTKSPDGKPSKQIHFDEKALAKRLGMSVKTLQNWRHQGIGPKWEKIGRAVRYRLRDIIAFEKSFPSGSGNFD
jgi:Fe2+ transport system protein B